MLFNWYIKYVIMYTVLENWQSKILLKKFPLVHMMLCSYAHAWRCGQQIVWNIFYAFLHSHDICICPLVLCDVHMLTLLKLSFLYRPRKSCTCSFRSLTPLKMKCLLVCFMGNFFQKKIYGILKCLDHLLQIIMSRAMIIKG